jgi:hypothetical protein
MSEFNGRQIVNMPATDDPYAYVIAVRDAIAALPNIFELNGRWVLHEGKAIRQVNRDVLIELGQTQLATRHLINRGSEAAPDWAVTLQPVHIDEITIRALLTKPGREGGLEGKVPRA